MNFKSFTIAYSQIHGWLSIIICTIGIIFNILNVIILNRIKLALKLVNNLLILIAFTNSITMITYLPYCLHYYVLNVTPISADSDPERDTLFWTLYEILSTMICSTTHFLSIWFTVYLSIYRYLNLLQSLNSLKRRKSTQFEKFSISLILSNAKLILMLIIIFCVIFCIPTYLLPQYMQNQYENTTLIVY